MSTQTQRERFEAWKCTVPPVHREEIACMWAAWLAAEAAAIERCARWCDEYAGDRWDLYKGRAPYKGNEEGRANPRIEGESDGASACAEGLRSLLKHDY